MEVLGPTREIELPVGWLFAGKFKNGWEEIVNPITNEAMKYFRDLRVVCSTHCFDKLVKHG